MEFLLGCIKRDFLLVVVAIVLSIFSLSSLEDGTKEVLELLFLWGGMEDGAGKKFEILLSGILSLEGPNGGFFSVMVFWAAFRDGVEPAAKALVSCFSLSFLSSAN